MIHHLDYSKTRAKTEWRWWLALLSVVIASAGVVVAVGYWLAKPMTLEGGMIIGLPGIVLLGGAMVAAHCLIVHLTRAWDRRRQTRVLLGVPVAVALGLVGLSMAANSDRQRFREYVTDPVPPSIQIEHVRGTNAFSASWVFVFRIDRPDLDRLLLAGAYQRKTVRDVALTDVVFEYVVGKPVRFDEATEVYQSRGRDVRTCYYRADEGRAYFHFMRF